LLEAQEALLGDVQDLVTSRTSFPIISDLPKDHYDRLTFLVICPHFPEHRYNADGMRTTKLQCKQLKEGKSSDMAKDSGSVDSEGDVSPPMMKIMEVMDDIQPMGMPVVAPSDTSPSTPEVSTSRQCPVLQLDTSAELALLVATSNPMLTSNPTSTINLMQASAISATLPTFLHHHHRVTWLREDNRRKSSSKLAISELLGGQNDQAPARTSGTCTFGNKKLGELLMKALTPRS
jgi:hypothetical protein